MLTARELRYLDLAELPEVPSIFDMSARMERPWLFFLHRFAQEIAKPVKADAGDIDYVPTQVLTEYVRHVLGGPDDPVLGIRYGSAVHPDGVCWVVFVDASGCTAATPGWETDHGHCLALERSSLRRYQATPSWTEIR